MKGRARRQRESGRQAGDRSSEPKRPPRAQQAGSTPGDPLAAEALELQRTLGNQAVQRMMESSGSVQRRWNPPNLGSFLQNAVDVAGSDPTEFTRYELKATNPSDPTVGTFISVQGQHPRAAEGEAE